MRWRWWNGIQSRCERWWRTSHRCFRSCPTAPRPLPPRVQAGDLPERPRWLPRRRVWPVGRPGRLCRQSCARSSAMRANRSRGRRMLLENKSAIIYGGGGAIGSAVARAFAAEGARVYLAGRTLEKLEKVADVIRRDGGQAHTAQLDALDEKAVDAYADGVAREAGSIDISFNLITHGDVQDTPLVAMTPEDFARPVETAVRTMFLTSRAAARHMIKQRSGVILVFGGEGDPPRGYSLGGLQVAFHAMEAMRRQHSVGWAR